ncbi:CBS domain-containing protein [Rhodoblastus acidophilus]|uniref:CBS domain-containing protein n=1 Tax=Rhodoblastus acidophilus TaxID=1074 RepID=A0A212RXR3_RHOAC|nr:CBS domain-containing protein [Rhodoblastus acidophilus]MCW2315269.1 CBS domain-containing protein [Rhodoblastus acidophilus]PPQ38460.1 CBS domain-containing protein [Rhodoblastus acidophilus]RAI17271.1 CBS domain-containing protein [Rhodoblastus acidophilus]SNB77511.1 CBS domain-containing protein [Rhodoblastus acidophilus]
MQVQSCMSEDVLVCTPDHSIREAAQAMKDIDAGLLPVGENDRLVGMITDRDIAVRAVADGKSCDTPVREVMTTDVQYCFEDEELSDAAAKMGALQVRRLPVLDHDKRLVGIVSLGDIARLAGESATDALGRVADSGSQHRQS